MLSQSNEQWLDALEELSSLKDDLANEKVMSKSFSHDAEFLRVQNEQLAKRFSVYKKCVDSLCAEVNKFSYGQNAVRRFRNNTQHL